MYKFSQHQLSRQYRSGANVISSDLADFPSVFLDGHYLIWNADSNSWQPSNERYDQQNEVLNLVYQTNSRIDDLSGNVALNISALSELLHGAPQSLDTLKEIADVLGDPNNIGGTVITKLSLLDNSVANIDSLNVIQNNRLDEHDISFSTIYSKNAQNLALINLNMNDIATNLSSINQHTTKLNEHNSRIDDLEVLTDDHVIHFNTNDTSMNLVESRMSHAEGRITVNEGDLSAHHTRLTTIENEMNVQQNITTNHESRIVTNENTLTNHENRITWNEAIILDHSSNITTLHTDVNQIETILEGASGVRLDNFDSHFIQLDLSLNDLFTSLYELGVDFNSTSANTTLKFTNAETLLDAHTANLTILDTSMNLAEGRLTSVESRTGDLETLTINHTGRLDGIDTINTTQTNNITTIWESLYGITTYQYPEWGTPGLTGLSNKPHQYLIRQNLDDIEYLKNFTIETRSRADARLTDQSANAIQIGLHGTYIASMQISLVQHNATLVAHDARLTANEPQIADHKARIVTLEALGVEHEGHLSILDNSYNYLETWLNDLPTQNKQRLDTLLGGASEALDTIKELSDMLGDPNSLASSITAGLSILDNSVNLLETISDDHNARITDNDQRIIVNTGDIATHLGRLNGLDTKTDNHAALLVQYGNNLGILDNSANIAESRLTSLESRATTLEYKSAQFTTHFETNDISINLVEGRMTTAETRVSATEYETLINTNRLDSLDISVNSAESRIETLEDRATAIETLDNQQDVRLTNLENDLDQANTGVKARLTSTEGRITTNEGKLIQHDTLIDVIDLSMGQAFTKININQANITQSQSDIVNIETIIGQDGINITNINNNLTILNANADVTEWKFGQVNTYKQNILTMGRNMEIDLSTNSTNTTGNTIINTTAAKQLNELTDVKFDDSVDFNNSLIIGHTTTGTLSAAENNIGIGFHTLNELTSGADNICIGVDSGESINGGQKNVFIGTSAGNKISSGDDNIAIGDNTLSENVAAPNNIAIGSNSLLNTEDGYGNNVALGVNTGVNNIHGSNNLFLGHYANTVVGADSLTNAIAIGYNAKVSKNNKIQLGNAYISEVHTAGKLTTGNVTWPNTIGEENQYLKLDANGNVVYSTLPEDRLIDNLDAIDVSFVNVFATINSHENRLDIEEPKIAQNELSIVGLTSITTTHSGQITTLDSSMATVETSLVVSHNNIATHETKIDDLETLSSSNKTRITNSEGTISTLVYQTNLLGSGTDAIDIRLQSAESTIINHTNRIDTLEGEMDNVENRVTTIENHILIYDRQESILKDHSSNLITLDASMNLVENRLAGIDDFNIDVSSTLINHNNRINNVEVLSAVNENGIEDLSQAIFTLVNGAPDVLNTLSELSAALGNDSNYASATANILATKAPKHNPIFTGDVIGIDASMVGLNLVDNTADLDKPICDLQKIKNDLIDVEINDIKDNLTQTDASVNILTISKQDNLTPGPNVTLVDNVIGVNVPLANQSIGELGNVDIVGLVTGQYLKYSGAEFIPTNEIALMRGDISRNLLKIEALDNAQTIIVSTNTAMSAGITALTARAGLYEPQVVDHASRVGALETLTVAHSGDLTTIENTLNTLQTEIDANDSRLDTLMNDAPEALDTLKELADMLGNPDGIAGAISTKLGVLDLSMGLVTFNTNFNTANIENHADRLNEHDVSLNEFYTNFIEVDASMNTKQEKLIAGSNITFDGNIINASAEIYLDTAKLNDLGDLKLDGIQSGQCIVFDGTNYVPSSQINVNKENITEHDFMISDLSGIVHGDLVPDVYEISGNLYSTMSQVVDISTNLSKQKANTLELSQNVIDLTTLSNNTATATTDMIGDVARNTVYINGFSFRLGQLETIIPDTVDKIDHANEQLSFLGGGFITDVARLDVSVNKLETKVDILEALTIDDQFDIIDLSMVLALDGMKVNANDIVELKIKDDIHDASLVDLTQDIKTLNELHTEQGTLIDNNKIDINDKLDIEKARILLTEVAIDILDSSMASVQLVHLPMLDLSMNNSEALIDVLETRVDTVDDRLDGLDLSANTNISDIALNRQGIDLNQNRLNMLLNSAPEVLDTLVEISESMNEDPNLYSTLTTAIGTKAPKLNPIFTGEVFFNATDLSDVHFKTGHVRGLYPADVKLSNVDNIKLSTWDGKEGFVDAFSGITKLGDVNEGKWEATVIDTIYGGTGAASIEEFLTMNGLRPDYEMQSHYPALELIGQLFSTSSRFAWEAEGAVMATSDASAGKIIYTVEDQNEELGIDFKTATVTSTGLTLIQSEDLEDLRINLGIGIGVNVQPYNKGLLQLSEIWDDASANPVNGWIHIDELGRFVEKPLFDVGIEFITSETELDARNSIMAQKWFAGLDSIGLLETSSDKMIYTTTSNTYATTDLTSAGRDLLAATDISEQQLTLELVPGVDVQTQSDALESISLLDTEAGQIIYTTALDTYATTGLSDMGRDFLDETDPSNARAILGLSIGEDVQGYSILLESIADGTYVGDDNITTVGEITIGQWKGTKINDAYISSANIWNTSMEEHEDRLDTLDISLALVTSDLNLTEQLVSNNISDITIIDASLSIIDTRLDTHDAVMDDIQLTQTEFDLSLNIALATIVLNTTTAEDISAAVYQLTNASPDMLNTLASMREELDDVSSNVGPTLIKVTSLENELDTLQIDVVANASEIADNLTSITTNKSNIALNSTNIGLNKLEIDVLDERADVTDTSCSNIVLDIQENANDILAIDLSMVEIKSDIATIETNISTILSHNAYAGNHAARINTLEGYALPSGSLQSSISTNALNITSNSTNISTIVGGNTPYECAPTASPAFSGTINLSNVTSTTFPDNGASGIQEYHASLTSIAGLTTAANKMIYSTASNTYSTTDLTSNARTLLAASSVTAQQQAMDLEIGVDVQSYSDITNKISLLNFSQTGGGKMIYTVGANTFATADITEVGREILAEEDLSGVCGLLGVRPGIEVQEADYTLTTIADLTLEADKMIYTSSEDTFSATTITSQARSFLSYGVGGTTSEKIADQRDGLELSEYKDCSPETGDVLIYNGTIFTKANRKYHEMAKPAARIYKITYDTNNTAYEIDGADANSTILYGFDRHTYAFTLDGLTSGTAINIHTTTSSSLLTSKIVHIDENGTEITTQSSSGFTSGTIYITFDESTSSGSSTFYFCKTGNSYDGNSADERFQFKVITFAL